MRAEVLTRAGALALRRQTLRDLQACHRIAADTTERWQTRYAAIVTADSAKELLQDIDDALLLMPGV